MLYNQAGKKITNTNELERLCHKQMNTVDANQHKLENVLEHGDLIGCNDGVTWAASA